jgi:hypothetical protein
MEPKCPNCGKAIRLVGAAELKDEFGLGPNTVQHARDRGKFPAPWLSFGNRNIWLRNVIEKYVRDKKETQIESALTELMKSLDGLPEATRRSALEKLTKA